MIALLLATALAQTPGAAPHAPAGSASVEQVDELARERATIERWRDCLLIDRPREVLEEAAARPADAGEWNGEALALVARAAFAARGREQALQWLARGKVSAHTSAWIELERARIALESDELPAAIGMLFADPSAAAPKLASYPDAWLYAGRAWTRLGEAARGAPFLQRFVELAPFDVEAPSALHALAQAALAQNDGRAAAALLRRADENARWQAYRRVRVLQIRESPDEPLPRIGLAQLWLQAKDAQRARRVLDALLALHPDHVQAWFLVGEAERLRDDLDAAAAAYGKTLELEPEHVLARHNRATIHRLRGRIAEARADYERVVDGPRSADELALNTHLALARLLDAAGEHELARQRFERYRELGGRETLKP